jgi:hypothetical protein
MSELTAGANRQGDCGPDKQISSFSVRFSLRSGSTPVEMNNGRKVEMIEPSAERWPFVPYRQIKPRRLAAILLTYAGCATSMLFGLLLDFAPKASAQAIDDYVFKSVIQVSTPQSIGTGFLIAVPFEGARNDQWLASFLVTNKHMVGQWNPIDGDYEHYGSITLHLYRNVRNETDLWKKLRSH